MYKYSLTLRNLYTCAWFHPVAAVPERASPFLLVNLWIFMSNEISRTETLCNIVLFVYRFKWIDQTIYIYIYTLAIDHSWVATFASRQFWNRPRMIICCALPPPRRHFRLIIRIKTLFSLLAMMPIFTFWGPFDIHFYFIFKLYIYICIYENMHLSISIYLSIDLFNLWSYLSIICVYIDIFNRHRM